MARAKLAPVAEPKKLPVLIPVRPSALQIAEKCDRAPYLGHKYKQGNANTEHGKGVDGEASADLSGGPAATDPEARAIVDWVRTTWPIGAEFYVQRKIKLVDPVTGEVLREGTADLIINVPMYRKVWVVDFKSKGQWWSGYLAKPDDNLQQHCYGMGAAMEFGADEYEIVLALFDGRGVDPQHSQAFPAASWWPMLERLKAIKPFDPDGPEPEATIGDHCDHCWQRMHCSAHLLPAMAEVPVALVPFTEGGGELTPERALAALDWIDRADDAIKKAKRVRDLVEAQVDTFVRLNGPVRRGDKEYGPVPTNGKRSGPTVAELEKAGLQHLIKDGDPGVAFKWRKAG